MERGSSKHSPRVDEQMEHEVEGMMTAERPTRAEEWLEPYIPAQRTPVLRPSADTAESVVSVAG